MASPSSSASKFRPAFLGSFIPFPENHARSSFKISGRSKIVVPVTLSLSGRDSRAFRKTEYLPEGSLHLSGKTARPSELQDSADEIGKFHFSSVREILGFFGSNGRIRSLSVFNEILSTLIRRDENDLASELCSYLPSYELVPDLRTFSLMVRCHCRRNKFDKAKQTMDDMLEMGYRPDIATFTVLIDCFCKDGKLQKAFEIFDSMRKIQCEPTIRVYNCLLKGLCYVGRVEEAYEMIIAIKNNKSVTPDMYTFTTVMDGFCKVGRSDDAKELLHEAMEAGLEPGPITYNTLFDGYCREGRPMKGFNLLKLMKQRKCSPDSITYSTLMNGFLKWGKFRAALSVYKEMERTGLEPEDRILKRLFRCLCGKSLEEPDLVEDAHQLFDKTTKRALTAKRKLMAIDVDVLGMHSLMIRAFCVGRRFDEAVECLERAIELGIVPRTIAFNNLVQGLSGEGRIEEAINILLVMYGQGKIPSTTSYDTLIKELNRRGMWAVASALYGAALKRRVFPRRT
ncbi:PREDICTED: pentatricopeptide repeat-containing protein At1g09900-like [Tarenaya hassleriana]|uniref:pentatricopeptide repeat-containing protein At1g09900-like n=1 Tax=Tarenaya hassleriana TaxID=28532 RepID=UPI00053C9013|nr:PREDICTED: pentatricopeptide repeat-containing protein At1g09900-like [Tarenaya hassleriana]